MLQFGGSLWAKKMVVLRTKISGKRFYYKLFLCVIDVGLLGCYVLNWALWLIRSQKYEVC